MVPGESVTSSLSSEETRIAKEGVPTSSPELLPTLLADCRPSCPDPSPIRREVNVSRTSEAVDPRLWRPILGIRPSSDSYTGSVREGEEPEEEST